MFVWAAQALSGEKHATQQQQEFQQEFSAAVVITKNSDVSQAPLGESNFLGTAVMPFEKISRAKRFIRQLYLFIFLLKSTALSKQNEADWD